MKHTNNVKEYLTAECQLLLQHRVQTINGYKSMGEFILRNGRYWRSIPERPKWVLQGVPNSCFMNAAHLCVGRDDLTYCEGYALGAIPLMHAWCIDKEGNVIDPTWKERRYEYYGIAFNREYLISSLCKNGVYGIIDRWIERWPVLRDDPKQWRHPINDLPDKPPKRVYRRPRSVVATLLLLTCLNALWLNSDAFAGGIRINSWRPLSSVLAQQRAVPMGIQPKSVAPEMQLVVCEGIKYRPLKYKPIVCKHQ